MDEEKREKLNALGNKIKEHAAQSGESDGGAKRGLFGFGSKPTATNAATTSATTTTTAAKPTATTSGVKPTTTTAAKPTATTSSVKPTTTTAAKPTATTSSVKPTTTTSVKPTATTSVKPTTNAAAKTAFTDVPSSSYYAEAVAWAVQKGITSGTTETTFTPNNPCHRGHAATFLWRSKGSPAPKTANNPFTDVDSNSPFYKAILWATENKIIEPKTASTYEPTAPCTRGDVLTYLLRAEGKTGATEADAVKWANLKKLLAGFAGGANAPCTRADIVTFLYRVKTN